MDRKNFWKRVGAVIAVTGMLTTVGLMPRVAWADTTTLTFNFAVNQSEDVPRVTLRAVDAASEGWTVMEPGQVGTRLEVLVEGAEREFGLDLEDGARNRIDASRVGVTCANDTNCTMTVSGVDTSLQSNGIVFMIPGDAEFNLYHDGRTYDWSNLLEDTDFAVEYRRNDHEAFDGGAYAIWACGADDSEVCLHLIEGIENRDGATEYYPATTITDIRDASRTFDKFGEYEDEDYMRGMALAKRVEDWVKLYTGNDAATVADVDWSTVNIHSFLRGEDMGEWERRLISEGVCEAADGGGRRELEDCVDQYLADNHIAAAGVKLQPVGETQGESSYTSYGDRNFRLTIYDADTYRGIELGTLDDLYYVPAYYEDATFVDAIDISGTFVDKPAVMHSVLLEDTLNIKASLVGGLEIASIRPWSVPDGAVTVTKNSDDSYKIVFNSNYYDTVIFEISDTNGSTYYLMVERSILDTYINDSGAWTTFTFDAETSYSDYELVANFIYKDGSSEQMVMENTQHIDDGLGNITHDYETASGRNLKIANYRATPQGNWRDELEGVYFNVRMSGSTDTTYNGTLVGSGKGVYEPAPWRERR